MYSHLFSPFTIVYMMRLEIISGAPTLKVGLTITTSVGNQFGSLVLLVFSFFFFFCGVVPCVSQQPTFTATAYNLISMFTSSLPSGVSAPSSFLQKKSPAQHVRLFLSVSVHIALSEQSKKVPYTDRLLKYIHFIQDNQSLAQSCVNIISFKKH